MPAVTVSVSLPLEIFRMVEEVMEREKMSRSNAVAYLIGWVMCTDIRWCLKVLVRWVKGNG
jgi:hypothetical protein